MPTSSISKILDAAISTRHLLVKTGSNRHRVAVTEDADEMPLGTVPLTGGELDLRGLNVLGQSGIIPMIAAETVAVGEEVFTAPDGKVQNRPTAAGTYWQVGFCVELESPSQGAGIEANQILVAPCVPIKTVITE